METSNCAISINKLCPGTVLSNLMRHHTNTGTTEFQITPLPPWTRGPGGYVVVVVVVMVLLAVVVVVVGMVTVVVVVATTITTATNTAAASSSISSSSNSRCSSDSSRSSSSGSSTSSGLAVEVVGKPLNGLTLLHPRPVVNSTILQCYTALHFSFVLFLISYF